MAEAPGGLWASRRRRRLLGALVVLALVAAPGCRTSGELSYGFYDWGAATFAPNPATTWTYFGGLGLLFVAASPLLLISWPLTALFYPEDEDAYELAATLAPAAVVGTLGGALLSLPFYPFGLPFLPDEPAPPPGGGGGAPPPQEPSRRAAPPAPSSDGGVGDRRPAEGPGLGSPPAGGVGGAEPPQEKDRK